MQLNHQEVVRILREKGLTHLYHANTVRTSYTFILNGGLLSRGAVEHYKFDQTPQDSDSLDKKFNVWNDIFLDSIDLHEYFHRQNHYGPVVFKFNLNLLEQGYQLPLWITKNNPIYWMEGENDQERYMQNLNELNDLYNYGSYRQMITFRNTYNYLPFSPSLEEIIIDDPELKWTHNEQNLYKEAERVIKEAISLSHHDYLQVNIRKRNCGFCYCKSNYSRQVTGEQLRLKFSGITS